MSKECEIINDYTMQTWLDEILSIDESGEIEWERDEDGNIVQLTDHVGRPLYNPYTGEPLPKPIYLQEGTRITAERMNHIEKHLCSLYGWKDIHDSALEYIMIVLELEGSISGGQGTFFDAISDLTPKGIRVDNYSASLKSRVIAGATALSVDKTEGVKVGDEVNIYDSENFETVKVLSVDSESLTVSELTYAYEAGAYVKRSTVKTDRENKKYVVQSYTVYDISSRVL